MFLQAYACPVKPPSIRKSCVTWLLCAAQSLLMKLRWLDWTADIMAIFLVSRCPVLLQGHQDQQVAIKVVMKGLWVLLVIYRGGVLLEGKWNHLSCVKCLELSAPQVANLKYLNCCVNMYHKALLRVSPVKTAPAVLATISWRKTWWRCQS